MINEEGVDKIIAVGHAGYNLDKELAAAVEGVDVVVGGHTDTFLYTGEILRDKQIGKLKSKREKTAKTKFFQLFGNITDAAVNFSFQLWKIINKEL